MIRGDGPPQEFETERAFNSMESPPVYCYARQAEDVLRLCRFMLIRLTPNA